ncbi:MAG: hypothetical protein ACE37F_13090 [Nannocystaceae bacterium]|nr:ribbon-helix-helix domain-containing protein [bacterium]
MHWYAPYGLASRLGREARQRGKSLSAVTREAVEQWLARREQPDAEEASP